MKKSVGILGTGDMGSAIARCLGSEGYQVHTCLDGRSERSRYLATNAKMKDTESLEELMSRIDIMLSVMPPDEATKFAETICPQIYKSKRDILFVDCNAVAPATAARNATIADQHTVRFQDAGIVGAAPSPGGLPVRIYTSGPWCSELDELSSEMISIKPLGEDIGQASALKMVYASLTKGTNALRVAALMAGEQLGIGAQVREEWAYSLPEVYKAMESRVPDLASDSARWVTEMQEIADTYSSVGLTSAFHNGAEEIYRLLSTTDLAAESREEARQSGRTTEETLHFFIEALNRPEPSN